MNQKPEIPGEDNRMKKHPAKRPSKLEADRKLKPNPGAEVIDEHETSARHTGRHQAPRNPSRDDAFRGGRNAA